MISLKFWKKVTANLVFIACEDNVESEAKGKRRKFGGERDTQINTKLKKCLLSILKKYQKFFGKKHGNEGKNNE